MELFLAGVVLLTGFVSFAYVRAVFNSLAGRYPYDS
jgi:hypothetical protein